jgi:hypothetical protein
MEAKNLGDIFFPLVAQELTAKRKGERNYPAKQVVRLGRDGGSKAVGRSRSAPMPDRRFPPPWSVDELEACFVVKDGRAKAGVYLLRGRTWPANRVGEAADKRRGAAHCREYRQAAGVIA